jgi:23S rRNA (adenine2030-N6)-methyltransferase
VQCKKPNAVNYRHAFHAANYADVLKHALLVRLVRALQKKETGFVFVDTHAGRGRYDLSLADRGDSRAREPEWPGGIGRLWDRRDAPPGVADYLEIVRRYDRAQGNLGPAPRFYPGSPRIVRLLARPQDRLELWEKHPAEFAALRDEFKGERRVSVHGADGYGAVRACLPPAERRALVLVDPPFEATGEWSEVSAAIAEGLRRLPGGTFAVWYPLTGRARRDGFLGWLENSGAPSLLAEMVVDPLAPRMTGCGVVVVNPPWRFDEEACSILGYLPDALALGQAAHGSVRWILSE